MAKFKIMSLAPLKSWCFIVQVAQRLLGQSRAKTKGLLSKPQKRTREQELMERCRT